MSILSFEFIFFLALVVFSTYLVPLRLRWIHLLLASMIFYGLVSLPYLLLVIILTAIDYMVALGMDRAGSQAGKKVLLLSGLTVNIGVLFFFKYLNSVVRLVQDIFPSPPSTASSPLVRLLVPLGISYYIFKKLSYLLDVYRGQHPSEKNPAKLLLFVLFFPEITAGPIDRASHLISQFSGRKDYDHQQVLQGIQLILWGLFKKLVIADRLALLVNPVYDHPSHFGASHLVLATLCFSIQIYCDFSGYTDIAVGIGHTLGIRLSENFNRPYFSKSIGEFWNRWHITLSHWLRDYIFLPLAYSLSRKIKKDTWLGIPAESLSYSAGVLVTMTICGIWHGSGLNFLFWGALHGLFLTVSFFTRKFRKKIKKLLKINRFRALDHFQRRMGCFMLVAFSWIFFRANSISDGFQIVAKIFSWDSRATSGSREALFSVASLDQWMAVAAGILFLFLVELFQSRISFGNLILSRPAWQRWMIYYGIIFLILFFGQFQADVFIYEGF